MECRSVLVDGNDGLVFVEGKLVGGDRELDWAGCLEDGVEFLKLLGLLVTCSDGWWGKTYSSLAGLREEEVGNDTLSSTPNNEDDVGLPLNVLDGDGPGELVQETGTVDEKGLEGHTLGTNLEGDTFDGVESLQWGDVEGVDDGKDENKREDCTAGTVVGVDSITIGNRTRNPRGGKSAGRSGHTDPDDSSAEETSKHELPPTEDLDEVGTDDCGDELGD